MKRMGPGTVPCRMPAVAILQFFGNFLNLQINLINGDTILLSNASGNRKHYRSQLCPVLCMLFEGLYVEMINMFSITDNFTLKYDAGEDVYVHWVLSLSQSLHDI